MLARFLGLPSVVIYCFLSFNLGVYTCYKFTKISELKSQIKSQQLVIKSLNQQDNIDKQIIIKNEIAKESIQQNYRKALHEIHLVKNKLDNDNVIKRQLVRIISDSGSAHVSTISGTSSSVDATARDAELIATHRFATAGVEGWNKCMLITQNNKMLQNWITETVKAHNDLINSR